MSSTRDLPSAFDVPIEHADSRIIEHPLDRCPDHFTVLRRYMISATAYKDPLRYRPPGPRTPDVEFHNAYFSYEKPERQVDDLLFFVRLFATIPVETEHEPSSVVLDVPGFSVSPSFAAAKTITAVRNEGGGILRITAASHGYSAADRLSLLLSGTNLFGGFVVRGEFDVLSGATTDDFHISTTPPPALLAGRTYTASGTAEKFSSESVLPRASQTRSVATEIVREYFLLGHSVVGSRVAYTKQDIPLPPKFTFRGESGDDGEETNTLTSSTVPTVAQYVALVTSRAQLLAESPTLEDYLPGGFVCRRSVFWTAQ